MNKANLGVINLTVAVAALGYFVDVFDLILFSAVRVQSLTDLGVAPENLLAVGHNILNWQMAGMLLGAILLGPLGDIKGRKYVLIGSIVIYSLATLACGFVQDVGTYTTLRFIAGVGLAIELGAAITLTAEILPQLKRGYGPMLVAVAGMFGGIMAGLASEALPWRWCYVIGGVLGLALMLLRSGTLESGLFQTMAQKKRVGFHHLRALVDRAHALRLVACIITGVPIWFLMGILVTGGPEIGQELGLATAISAGICITVSAIGFAFGDIASTAFSQFIRRRRGVVQIMLSGFLVSFVGFIFIPPTTAEAYYIWLGLFGFLCGYWVVLLTAAAEMYGTNLRATVSGLVPNFVRASIIPVSTLFAWLKPEMSTLGACLVVGLLCITLALLTTLLLPETFHRSLDYDTKAGKR